MKMARFTEDEVKKIVDGLMKVTREAAPNITMDEVSVIAIGFLTSITIIKATQQRQSWSVMRNDVMKNVEQALETAWLKLDHLMMLLEKGKT